MLRKNLLELRDGLVSLVPNRPDIATEMRDGIPVESITAHEGVSIDVTRLAILLECAVSWIVQLEAPVDNEQTRLWHAETLRLMSDQSRDISTVVPAAVWSDLITTVGCCSNSRPLEPLSHDHSASTP